MSVFHLSTSSKKEKNRRMILSKQRLLFSLQGSYGSYKGDVEENVSNQYQHAEEQLTIIRRRTTGESFCVPLQ